MKKTIMLGFAIMTFGFAPLKTFAGDRYLVVCINKYDQISWANMQFSSATQDNWFKFCCESPTGKRFEVRKNDVLLESRSCA